MFSGLRVHRSALPDGPPLGKGTLTVKVDSHFFIRANKKERRAARKAGTTEVKYIAFNKNDVTNNTSDSYFRYKVPLPEGTQDGEIVEVQLADAVPMTAKDFMYELESDLDHHPGNMMDIRALLLVVLFFGPFFIISYQVTMFAHDLGVRGPDAVKGGDLFKLWRPHDFAWGQANRFAAIPADMQGRYWGGVGNEEPGAAVVFDRLRGENLDRDRWEREIALKWAEGNVPDSIWDVAYKGDIRSEFQKSNKHCSGIEVGSFFTTVKPVDADGTPLETFRSDATIQGAYCMGSLFFLVLLLVVPFLLLGGFIHMTIGWRRDLKHYVKTALKLEMSDAAKAVQIDEATDGDRFGVRKVRTTTGDAKGMIGGNNAYHAGWLRRDTKIGDTDGDGSIDTSLQNKHGPIFALKKLHYKMTTSPEELMLYTEASEIALALFSVYRFSNLNLGDTYGVEAVLLVAAAQCIVSPALLLSIKPSLCIVAVQVFDMFVDFFYASMALSRSRTVFGARDDCIEVEWNTHPCNGIFNQWTAVDVFLTFYACIIPPFLFSRKVVRSHTFIAWQNFQYYFDRSGTSKVAIKDKQLNKLLHWSSRNIILLPGPARDNFLSRVKFIYGTGLLGTFALWWYMELLPENELCENSNSLFRAVPRDFRTGDPTLDSDIVTCEGYMAYGTDLFGQVYNHTLCAANFTLIEHNYLTYAKACPRVCGSCNADLGVLATETTEARQSALVMTIVLVFGCTISGMLCRATPAGEYASAWLEAWEGNDESLQQWKEFRDASMGQIRAEVSRDRLQLDRDNARRQAERDQLAFNNPMNDGEDEEAPSVQITGRADKRGHYHDDDDDI